MNEPLLLAGFGDTPNWDIYLIHVIQTLPGAQNLYLFGLRMI